jgi:hypothetical protein
MPRRVQVAGCFAVRLNDHDDCRGRADAATRTNRARPFRRPPPMSCVGIPGASCREPPSIEGFVPRLMRHTGCLGCGARAHGVPRRRPHEAPGVSRFGRGRLQADLPRHYRAGTAADDIRTPAVSPEVCGTPAHVSPGGQDQVTQTGRITPSSRPSSAPLSQPASCACASASAAPERPTPRTAWPAASPLRPPLGLLLPRRRRRLWRRNTGTSPAGVERLPVAL